MGCASSRCCRALWSRYGAHPVGPAAFAYAPDLVAARCAQGAAFARQARRETVRARTPSRIWPHAATGARPDPTRSPCVIAPGDVHSFRGAAPRSSEPGRRAYGFIAGRQRGHAGAGMSAGQSGGHAGPRVRGSFFWQSTDGLDYCRRPRYPEVIGEIEKQPDRGAFWKSISSGTSAIATIPRIAGF